MFMIPLRGSLQLKQNPSVSFTYPNQIYVKIGLFTMFMIPLRGSLQLKTKPFSKLYLSKSDLYKNGIIHYVHDPITGHPATQ